MYEIEVTLKSLCPYIQNRPEQRKFEVDENGKWREITIQGKLSKEFIDPEKAGHKDENGYFIPAKQIWAAMRDRSSNVKLGKGRTTLKNLFISCIRVEPAKIYLGKTKPDEIYNDPIFKKSRDGGEMVYNPRPMFHSWEAKIKVVVLEDSIPESCVMDCLKIAGIYQGIGSRHGEYGRFEVIR